jgi:succinoglycan biosynthesis transport protein ExoP
MNNLTLSELARAVWRRRFWFLVPLVLGLAGAVGALRVLPKTYRAATQVLVEAQKVPADYVKPTTTTSIEERLHTMEPQIKSRDNMARIIREMNLYPELRSRVTIDGLIDRLREDLTIRLQGDTFYIYFVGREPVKVARTANRVAELFIENNLEQRTNQAQGTSSFLERELEQTKTKLEQQEARIADFKRLNMGDLPEQRDTNLHAVEQLQSKLQINMDALDRAETRKLLLQRQIAELGYSLDSRVSPAAKPPAGPTRLEQARLDLAELRARYTDRHPDVIRAQAEVAHLEALERQKAAEPPPATADDDAPAPRPRLDPTTKAELASVDLEIRSLKAERERILSDTAAIQARLENVPRVEQELLSLSRDYDNIRRSYDSLLDKRLNAKLYENLEKSQQGEQFTILERALPPTSPYGPNKLLVLVMGLALGGGAGLLLAMLRDRTDSTYTDAASLQQAFPGVPLLATIPPFPTARTAPGAGETDMEMPVRTEMPQRNFRDRDAGSSRRVELRDDAPVINYLDPPSFAAEQYRGLAVQVEERIHPLGMPLSTRGYVLTVTSPEEAAGKTLTSLNLALTLTRGQERRVLLLEGDIWRPQLHTYLVPERPDRPGLQQVLEGRIALSEAVISHEGSSLDLLLAGSSGVSGDLMSGRRMSEVLNEARDAYEVVVVDSPPMNLLASARTLAARADGVVLVVRAGQTKKWAIEKTLSALGPEKLIGAVLNFARISERGYRGYY